MDDILILEQQNRLKEILKKNPEATLTEITAYTYNNENIDSRSKEGRIVKKFLLDNNIEYKNRSVFQRDRIELTKEQHEFIENNYKNQHYLDMAKILFKNNNLTHLNLEAREVNKYVEIIQKKDPTYLEMNTYVPKERNNPIGEYFPPRRSDQTLYRINRYLNLGWELEKLKAIQIKQVDTLQRYLNTFSFCYQINTYRRDDDRKLFEDAFIRYTYDKEDLTQEELDQFIVLCTEVVTASTILQQVEDLRQTLRQASEEEEGRNIKMQLNEAISNLQTEYNQCRGRQNKLYKSLVDDRSKKIQERKQENASILNLVQAWKDEERRKSIIHLAEAQKQNLEGEARRLSSMDELKAVIRGIDIDEMVHS
ncbi:MAG: hypothetical protein RL736_14 [Pseudomonadota bacterium]|jgi:hypothetical protein